MALQRSCRAVAAPLFRTEHFHSSAIAQMPRASPKTRANGPQRIDGLPPMSDDLIETNAADDTSAPGHQYLAQQRQALHYLRLIEHEMPRLVAYRKPFVPPSPSHSLVVRSITYTDEGHPVEVKRTIVAPVARLPLKDSAAIHKFKVLAGPRWTPDPPPNAGVGTEEGGREHGYFKISCEDFPKAAMNLKWASDVLDKLLLEANNSEDKFEDIPLDTRHVEAKVRKAKKGDHVYGRGGVRPSLRDFPKEWLPTASPTAESSTSSSNSQ